MATINKHNQLAGQRLELSLRYTVDIDSESSHRHTKKHLQVNMTTSRNTRKNKTHKMVDEQHDEKHPAQKDDRKKEA